MIEQILWFAGNLIGESFGFRDLLVHDTCLVEIMGKQINAQKINRTFLRTLCWVNSNITRHKKLSPEIV